ncbi:MAG: class I SAM-dependent methyltransferase, partial [Planctomycetes bacterium]|nr:class I SAM-dependent methyltransferase [Planctomycetota bacterium]
MRHWKTALISLPFVLATINSIQAATPGEELLQASGVKGGIVVHLGCGDGRTTAALHASDRFLVCGLDTDADKVQQAKAHIDSRGLYGKVSAERYDGKNLPYGDNIVNLIVLGSQCQVAREAISIGLVPGGVSFHVHPAPRNS